MGNELYEIFRRNFPFIVRAEDTVLHILEKEDNRVIEKKNEEGKLIGAAVVNKNTLMLLCVDKEYRGRGIGTELLKASESVVCHEGYDEIVVGAGDDYLMPGVPTRKRYFASENENLYPDIDEAASEFFARRGYEHSWKCNCFDMRFSLKDFRHERYSIGDTIDGIGYRWATMADLEEVCRCTDDACEDFTQWYRAETLYREDSSARVLVAVKQDEVVGTLIISAGTEREDLGSVGCTTVKRAYQGKHIAVNLVVLGTKYLRDIGLKEAFLGYTYSGLEHLYGYAGYEICIYYMMAKKRLA